MMKKAILASSLVLFSATSWAATTSCEDLKTKIETKLAGKGVSNYSLEVAPTGTETKERVVGNCDGGKNIIIYHKTAVKKAVG
jgi:hypothetical protein